jgi:hypothetical protein
MSQPKPYLFMKSLFVMMIAFFAFIVVHANPVIVDDVGDRIEASIYNDAGIEIASAKVDGVSHESVEFELVSLMENVTTRDVLNESRRSPGTLHNFKIDKSDFNPDYDIYSISKDLLTASFILRQKVKLLPKPSAEGKNLITGYSWFHSRLLRPPGKKFGCNNINKQYKSLSENGRLSLRRCGEIG